MTRDRLLPELQALRRLFRLARAYERDAGLFDKAWMEHSFRQADKLREDARWYYERWKWSRDRYREMDRQRKEAA